MSEPEAARVDAAALREPRHRVSPRCRSMWTASYLAQAVVVVVLLVLTDRVWHWWSIPPWVLVVIGVLLAAYVVVVPRWRYHVHRWEVTGTAVYTQSGWWTRERRIAPMSRVQTVDHRVGAIERIFGLATVRVTTASAAGAITIEGLEPHVALDVVEELTRIADTVPGDAT